jgi:hypothetical protein
MNLVPNQIQELLEELTFKSNPNLRPYGTIISYTKEMFEELERCRDDPIYFIRKYVKIIHPDRGLVLFDLYEYQERMVRLFHDNRYSINLTARQMGKTAVAAAYFTWYILFNPKKTVAILANKQATSDEILQRIRLSYENLPKWLQQGVRVFNSRSISLENGTRVFSAATSSAGIRGRQINVLYLDELAFVQNTQAEAFFTSVYPTIIASKESKIIITSTPNGFNHFWKYWNDAEKGINGFKYLRCHWWELPGRDKKWYNEQKAILGEMKAAQELDGEFLGSSRQLLKASTMAAMSAAIPIKEYYQGDYGGFKIYKEPEKDHFYVITVDVSRGRHLDASAFTIFDVTEYPHTIAATYNNRDVAPLMYAGILNKVHRQYNNAYMLIEINDVGSQVADELFYTYEVEEMFWTKTGMFLGMKGADPYPGIRTTKKTKRIGCANLKDIIENQQLIINDEKSISELSTFVQSDIGIWEADKGFNDDQVATLWLFAWLVTQPWFVDLTDKSMRDKIMLDKLKEIDEQLTPFGFIEDGIHTSIADDESLSLIR